MNPASERDARTFVRQELSWMGDFLRTKFGYSVRKARKLVREMVDVSI